MGGVLPETMIIGNCPLYATFQPVINNRICYLYVVMVFLEIILCLLVKHNKNETKEGRHE